MATINIGELTCQDEDLSESSRLPDVIFSRNYQY